MRAEARPGAHVSTAWRAEIEIPRYRGRPGAPARTLATARAAPAVFAAREPAPYALVAAGALPAPAATMVRAAARAAAQLVVLLVTFGRERVPCIRLIPYSTV